MNWIEHVHKGRAVSELYGEVPPSLESVDIFEIKFAPHGPDVLIRFDVDEYPQTPPDRWKAQKFNQVQIIITALNVNTLSIDYLDIKGRSKIGLSSTDGGKILKISGAISLNATTDHIILTNINAYQNGALG